MPDEIKLLWAESLYRCELLRRSSCRSLHLIVWLGSCLLIDERVSSLGEAVTRALELKASFIG